MRSLWRKAENVPLKCNKTTDTDVNILATLFKQYFSNKIKQAKPMIKPPVINSIDLNQYRAGGYFLLKQRARMCIPRSELPAECEPYSVAKWIAWTIPNTWGFTWATDERELSAVANGLGWKRERLLQTQQWVTTNDTVRFGYPNVFLSYATMQEFAHQFIDPTESVRYVGIGYHTSFQPQP